MTKYSLSYFIKLFEEIPEEQLSLTSDFNSTADPARADAWEWLTTDEADSLYSIVRPYGILVLVNDGVEEYAQLGSTVKQRIISFLNFIAKSKSCAV